jgi:two-component system, response regulator, stage 0 sporulation protein F
MIEANVLYVDDERTNLLLFKALLEKRYTIVTAEDAFAGLEILGQNNQLQVVISDMKMPRMNGIEFIRKAKEVAPDIQFYILTGFEITEEIQEALDSGLITRYFKKPFNINAISNEIDRALTGSGR